MTETEQAPPGVDPTRPSPARLYDYYLGGTTNYAVDPAAEDPAAADSDGSRGFYGGAARRPGGLR